VTVPEPLSAEQVAEELAMLHGWNGDPDGIEKWFQIPYHDGVALMVEVARTGKNVGHHADMDLRWGRVRFGITTHDAGHRVTELDFDLARRIDALAAEHEATPMA
jgi:4a-hydroxytetrahydrobiopterin dehydratase